MILFIGHNFYLASYFIIICSREVEKTKLSIAIEQQKLIKAAMEAETKMVIIQAEQLTNVTAIELEHKLLAKMSQQELAHIEGSFLFLY